MKYVVLTVFLLISCLSYAQDLDSDGVADSIDRCPNTVPGEQIGFDGCSIFQACRCTDSKDPNYFRKCVKYRAHEMRRDRVITRATMKSYIMKSKYNCNASHSPR